MSRRDEHHFFHCEACVGGTVDYVGPTIGGNPIPSKTATGACQSCGATYDYKNVKLLREKAVPIDGRSKGHTTSRARREASPSRATASERLREKREEYEAQLNSWRDALSPEESAAYDLQLQSVKSAMGTCFIASIFVAIVLLAILHVAWYLAIPAAFATFLISYQIRFEQLSVIRRPKPGQDAKANLSAPRISERDGPLPKPPPPGSLNIGTANDRLHRSAPTVTLLTTAGVCFLAFAAVKWLGTSILIAVGVGLVGKALFSRKLRIAFWAFAVPTFLISAFFSQLIIQNDAVVASHQAAVRRAAEAQQAQRDHERRLAYDLAHPAEVAKRRAQELARIAEQERLNARAAAAYAETHPSEDEIIARTSRAAKDLALDYPNNTLILTVRPESNDPTRAVVWVDKALWDGESPELHLATEDAIDHQWKSIYAAHKLPGDASAHLGYLFTDMFDSN